jgi:hypothetical protein
MLRSIYYTCFHALLRHSINFWGVDNESNNIFKLEKKVIWIISGVSKDVSCRQIFKDYNILMVACLYILEIVCYIKKYKDSLDQNVQFHNYNMPRKLDLHVQFCNMNLFRRSVVIMGIRLYNKVPDHVKKLEKNKLFESWDPFCYNMHFIQWMNLYCADCMCIV